MKPRQEYRRPETMTVKELKKEIINIQSDIHRAILEQEITSNAIIKEIRYLQNLRGGVVHKRKRNEKGEKIETERENLELKKWFSGKKKSDLVREYKELVRFSRFDRFTPEAQRKQENAAYTAWQKFTKNRENIPGKKYSYEEFLDLRNFFGNVTQDLIDKFGYDDVMESYNEVSTSAEGRVDIISAMYEIVEETRDQNLTPAERAIMLRGRLGLEE